MNDSGWNHRGIVLVAEVTVIQAREGTELRSYKGEADLPGATCAEAALGVEALLSRDGHKVL